MRTVSDETSKDSAYEVTKNHIYNGIKEIIKYGVKVF